VKESIFDKVKAAARIVEVVQHFGNLTLNRSKMAVCPFHEERRPSFSVKESEGIFKCFSCGEGGDAIDFVAKVKGIEAIDAARLLAEFYRIDDTTHGGKARVDKRHESKVKTTPDAPQGTKNDVKKYIEASAASVNGTDYYSQRGLTGETIKRFYLGFDEAKQVAVIPYSSKLNYYQTRCIRDKKFRKPKTEEAGAEPLWGAEALSKIRGGCVFVVESPFCALSVLQSGSAAVALCGATGGGKLLAEVSTKKPDCIFILSLDNDEAGRKAAQDLANSLFEIGAKFIDYNIASDCKDPNELLVHAPEELKNNITAAIRAARQKYRTEKDPMSFAELCGLQLPEQRWALDGLLCEGLNIICSAPKVGKSWMVLAMCLSIARGIEYMGFKATRMGCIYYALEDNAPSIQKRIKTAVGGNMFPRNAHVVLAADKIGQGLFEQIKRQLVMYPDVGFIAIDTFQAIRGKEIKKNDVYGNDVEELRQIKKFALDNNICILLVHHTRKMKDDDDIFNSILGSSGIRGTVDTMIMLTKKKFIDEDTLMSISGRSIETKEYIIRLNKTNFAWEMVGNAEEEARKKRKADYDGSVLVRTVKWLIGRNPYGWTGTASDILKAAHDMDAKTPSESPEAIGQAITKWKNQLYYDGIDHSDKRTGKERKHTFFKRVPPQRSMFGAKEE